MFDVVLNTPFICNANQLTGFYLIQIFTEKLFPFHKICSNFTLKKSTLNTTKFASLKKIHTKIIIVKKNIELNDLGFFCYSAKACPDLSGFMQAHLDRLIQSLCHTSLASPRNFRKLFTNKLAAFSEAFLHTILKGKKRNKVSGHMKHAAMASNVNVANYKHVASDNKNE